MPDPTPTPTPPAEPEFTLPTLKADVDSLKDTQAQILQKLEGLTVAQPAKPADPAPQPQPADWFVDPERATSERLNNPQTNPGLAWGMAAMANQAQTAKHIAFQDPTVQEVNKRWAKELEATMGHPSVSPLQRAAPETWRDAAALILGRHFKDVQQEVGSGKGFFTEPASAGAPPPSVPAKAELSGEHKAIADRMGIPHDRYLDVVQRMQKASTPGGIQ